ncbi:hypothetical protein [Kitasatospora sp. NPDC093679]|uniref:hypothetical protein n=1 Tax=Kitasatospora sp. NPDC093679 TaxID=3154983 RepID=UPI003437C3FD
MIPPHVDRLPRPERAAALAGHGRALTADRYLRLHAALDAGDHDDRHTALFLAVVRRDLDRVTAALSDPLLAHRALAAAGRLPVPDEALADLVRSAPRELRHDLYRLLRRSRRHALAERLLPEVRDRHDAREAARLLPACTPAAVDHWLPRLAVPDGVLQSLARTAPLAVARLLTAEAAPDRPGPQLPHRLRERLASVAARDRAAAEHLLATAPDVLPPDAVLRLLDRPGPVLAAIRSGAVTRLRPPAGPLPAAAERAARALPPEDLRTLAETCRPRPARGIFHRDAWGPEPYLLLLDPDTRLGVARERLAARPNTRRPDLTTLLSLDPPERAGLLAPALARTTDSPYLQAGLLALLPFDRAEEGLTALAGHHRHTTRMMGRTGLLRAAAQQDPQTWARVLHGLERAWHDHPEAREPVLAEAARTPEHLLAATPEQVLRDAVLTTAQARDSTPGCLRAADTWLRRTLRRAGRDGDTGRAAALLVLAVHLHEHPRWTAPAEPLGLSPARAGAVWTRLLRTPGFERPERLLAAAELLPPLPAVDTLLDRLVTGDHPPALLARAARVRLRAPGARGTRERRCAALVAADPGWARVDEVFAVLARRRTDLLPDVLAAGRTHPGGRFGDGCGPWLPALPADADRRARAAHTALVGPVASDEGEPLAVRSAAAAVLSDPDRLAALAGHAPQPVAAAALLRLADRAEPSAALPVLLAHLGGGVRGRAAVQGVRRLLGRLPEADGVRLLGDLLTRPGLAVGVGKELARALADLPDRPAADLALRVWELPALHRDVRAVLAAGLTRHLDRPGVAPRLAAALGEEAVREAVLGIPHLRLPAACRAPFDGLLRAAVRDGDPATAVQALAVRRSRGPLDEDTVRAVVERLRRPDEPDEVRSSAVALLADRPTEPAVATWWPQLVERLADEARHDPRQRRRLAELADHRSGTAVPPVLLDPLVPALLGAGLPARAAAAAFGAALGALLAGDLAPHRWDTLLDLTRDRPNRLPAPAFPGALRPDPALLHQVTERLRADGGTAAGLLGVRLLTAHFRWTDSDALRSALAPWQQHPDPDVAEQALVATD